MICQVPYQAFCVTCEALREWNLLLKGHLENLIGVFVHEGWSAQEQLVHKNAKRVPINGMPMSLVQNHLWWDILRSPTESVRAHPGLQPLNKSEISQFDEPILLKQNIFGLQVTVNQILAMDVLKNQYDLSSIKSDQL